MRHEVSMSQNVPVPIKNKIQRNTLLIGLCDIGMKF